MVIGQFLGMGIFSTFLCIESSLKMTVSPAVTHKNNKQTKSDNFAIVFKLLQAYKGTQIAAGSSKTGQLTKSHAANAMPLKHLEHKTNDCSALLNSPLRISK